MWEVCVTVVPGGMSYETLSVQRSDSAVTLASPYSHANQSHQQVDLKGEGISWYVVKSWKFLEKEDNWGAPTPESER